MKLMRMSNMRLMRNWQLRVFQLLIAISLLTTIIQGDIPVFTLIDDFNDNDMDFIYIKHPYRYFLWGDLQIAGLWQSGASQYLNIQENNKQLEITFYPNATGRGFGAGYTTRFELSGDFDVEVKYKLIEWPSSNGVRVGLSAIPGGHVERVSFAPVDREPWPPTRAREVYLTDFRGVARGFIPTEHREGALRLVRVGNQLIGYYWEPGYGWREISRDISEADRVKIAISAWSHKWEGENYFIGKTVKIAFDNFQINWCERIIFQPDSVVIAVPGIGGTQLGLGYWENDQWKETGLFSGPGFPWDVFLRIGNPSNLRFVVTDKEAYPERGDIIALRMLDIPSNLLGINIPSNRNDMVDLSRVISRFGYTVFTFPYDFRYSVRYNAESLENYINKIKWLTGLNYVNIVAHSMGGLVVKQYIKNKVDHGESIDIKNLITIGVPFLGAPTAFQAIRYGYNFGVPVINSEKVRNVAPTIPGIYNLVPYPKYFGDYYFIDMKPVEISSFLSNNYYTYLSEKEMKQFHEELDMWKIPLGVNVYNISGYNQSTLCQILEGRNDLILPSLFPTIIFTYTTAGDGTVPLVSATEINSKKQFYVELNHGAMLSDSDVLTLIANLLRNNENYTSEKIHTFLPKLERNCIVFGTLSPVRFVVYDSMGNRTGVLPDGTFEEQIPGSRVDVLDDHQFVSIPENSDSYIVVIEGLDEGTFTFIQTENDWKGNLIRVTAWLDVPTTPGAQSLLFTEFGAQGLALIVDSDGDSIPDTITPPTIQNVTNQLQMTFSGFRYNRLTRRYVQSVTITNITGIPIEAPVSIILVNLTQGVSLFNATGTTTFIEPIGSPYKTVNVGNDNILSPGESVSVVFEFTNPNNLPISYNVLVLAGASVR
jgi:hypothetical protein